MVDILVKKSKSDNDRRVVVTGLGVVSSIGIGWPEFWKNLIAGKSGISDIEYIDTSDYECHKGGEIKNFNPEEFISKHRAKQYGRSSQLALAATKLCLADSKIDLSSLDQSRVGVCLGTTMGEPQVMENADKASFSRARKLYYDLDSSIQYPASNISQNVSRYFGFKGKNLMFTTACAAGNYSIAMGLDLIRSGKMDFVIAGGADALSRIAFTGFGRLFAMASEKCQPFDKDRKGMMLGEGAGIVFLESLHHARERKAHIYAEIKSAGFSCDARHMTNPSIEGVTKAINKSLKYGDLSIGEADYFCAHGTGTIENDRAESKVINNITASLPKRIPVSSIKSMLGHTMGAASAIEAIACCLAIQDSIIPPTINYNNKDPECDICCVINKNEKKSMKVVLNNSQAFGGNNVCVLVGKIVL